MGRRIFILFSLIIIPPKYVVKLLICKFILIIHMAFNSEVALFNLLEDAQTSVELLAVIDDYLNEDEV